MNTLQPTTDLSSERSPQESQTKDSAGWMLTLSNADHLFLGLRGFNGPVVARRAARIAVEVECEGRAAHRLNYTGVGPAPLSKIDHMGIARQ
jgi:hypothetical protein